MPRTPGGRPRPTARPAPPIRTTTPGSTVKQFSCGDVVPTCTRTFLAPTDEEILAAVAEHARAEHGLTDIPPHLVDQVRQHIRSDE